MAILDVVEFADPIGNELVHRVPAQGSAEFRLGSQCVVREGQVAIFVHNGKTADVFSPGRHTLQTYNIPVLANLIGAVFGGRSPFRAEVYFVSTRLFADLKWGTTQPVLVRDPQFGGVRLRAFGVYAMQVGNVARLVERLVAARGLFTTADIEGYLRTIIVQHIADLLAEFMLRERMSVLDLASQYNELSVLVTAALQQEFADLGLTLQRFYISSITLPPEVEERLDAATGVNLFGGIDSYTRYKAAEALGNLGGNAAANAVVGLGLGNNLGGIAGNSVNTALGQSAAATATCNSCSASLPANARFCPACGVDQQVVAVKRCTGCNEELSLNARFCASCGKST